MLDDLQLGEFIYEQPAVGDIEYIFKHALTQEVAYNSVLIERRKTAARAHRRGAREILRRVTSTIISRTGASLQPQRQCRQGGRISRRAGHQAFRRSAYAEAMRQLSRRTGITSNARR